MLERNLRGGLRTLPHQTMPSPITADRVGWTLAISSATSPSVTESLENNARRPAVMVGYGVKFGQAKGYADRGGLRLLALSIKALARYARLRQARAQRRWLRADAGGLAHFGGRRPRRSLRWRGRRFRFCPGSRRSGWPARSGRALGRVPRDRKS